MNMANRKTKVHFALVTTIVLCFTLVSLAQDYKPLRRAERKAFLLDAKAVKSAAEEGNYVGVMRFGPGIVTKYESILLDPASKDLRPLYTEIEMLIKDVALLEAVDTFEVGIKKLIARGEYLSALHKYDDYFDYLLEKNNDSLVKIHKPVYVDCMSKSFAGNFESLKTLLSLKYGDRLVLDSLRHVVEASFKDKFVSLSSIEDLFAFQAQYPGLFKDDIENMINSYRLKMRLGVKRKPTIEKVEAFYGVFPEKDRIVDSVYQKLLYDDFSKNMDIMTASKYLTHFPAGKYSTELRTFIDVQQEQQRIVQLQRAMKGVDLTDGDD